jgi:hypothetical protein
VPFTVQELACDLKRVGHSQYEKVRVSGCDKSGRWATPAGTSKITPASSALMSSHRYLPYSHRARRVTQQLNAFFGCYLRACEEALQAAERELLEDNGGTFAERHLHPLRSAIGRPLFVAPSSEAEREVSSATCFSAFVQC